MSWLGLFPSEHERRLARDEAIAAIERHGDRAEAALRDKAQQTTSADRRRLYKMAMKKLRKRRSAVGEAMRSDG